MPYCLDPGICLSLSSSSGVTHTHKQYFSSNLGPHVCIASMLTHTQPPPWLPSFSAFFSLGFLLYALLCSSEIHLATGQGAPLPPALPTPPALPSPPAWGSFFDLLHNEKSWLEVAPQVLPEFQNDPNPPGSYPCWPGITGHRSSRPSDPRRGMTPAPW